MTAQSDNRPHESRHSFAEMTDQEFAREFFIPERSEQEKADFLPVDDEDSFDEEEKWPGQ